MDKDLLFRLLDANGVSGNETEVRNLILTEIKGYVDEVHTDKTGNLIARKKGRGKKVMLAAHMDQVGIIAKRISDEGRIYISTLGGIDPITLTGERVRITSSKGKLIYGVITTEQIHEGRDAEKLPGLSDLYVDCGVDGKELSALGIEIGADIALIQSAVIIGGGVAVSGKALDDRLGCYVLVQLIKSIKKPKNDLYFVFTVQEEVNFHGAQTSTFQVDPDWAIVVDVTNSRDFSNPPTGVLGKGTAVTVKDSDFIANKCLNDAIKEICAKKKILVQWHVGDYHTSDAMKISASKSGVPSTVIGPAIRNIHTTVEMASISDIDDTVLIMEELLKNPPDDCFT